MRRTKISSVVTGVEITGTRTRIPSPMSTSIRMIPVSRTREQSTVFRAVRSSFAPKRRTTYWGLAARPRPQPQNMDRLTSGV